jgi:hypothetical protein
MKSGSYSIEIEIRRSKIKTSNSYNENTIQSISREYFNEKTIIMTVRMPKSLYEKLEKIRKRYNVSRSYVIRKALKRFIKMIENDI